MEAKELRGVLVGTALWTALGLPDGDKVSQLNAGKREVKICSPFRADNSPSFSVSLNPDGSLMCVDWSSNEKWNDWDLIAKVKGLDKGDKPGVMKAWHDLAGVDWKTGERSKSQPKKARKKVEFKKPAIVQTAQGHRLKKEKAANATTDHPKLVATYDYCDEHGTLLHQTLRYEPKQFRQRRVAMSGEASQDGWVWSLKGGRVVPYRLPQITSDSGALILIVEGEKDADAAAGLLAGTGIEVTTLPMGAGKWKDEYSGHFVGRHVCILADFDEPKDDGKAAGFEGALKIGSVLRDIADKVGLLELTTLWSSAPYGSDISDWIERGRSAGVTDDELSEQLAQHVRTSKLPKGLVYDGCVWAGVQGLRCDEDILARRLVGDEQLIFSAASFWRYDGNGLWQREPDTLRIERSIAEALRAAGGGELITRNKVGSILSLAKSVRHCPVEKMNVQPTGMVNVSNGLLDTKTGTLHSPRADYMMQTRIPHAWQPNAKCPEWLSWIEERHADEPTRLCLQEMFGYVLATDINYHVFFFLYGDGGTGKSTCVSVLEKLVGENNRVSIQLEELDNAFMRSQLAGKSLYLCKELTTKSFQHVGLIKAIVSGDPIPVDVKYSQPYDFRPFGKMVMESNVIATTPDSSAGFSRRFVQIDWERPVPREKMDFNLLDKFDAEMPGILVWAMEGLKRLRARGHFALTKKSEKSRDQLMRHRSQVASYLNSGWLVDDANCRCPVNDLYAKYELWCETYDVVPFYQDLRSFMREVMSKKPEYRERKKRVVTGQNREWVIEGLGINTVTT